MKLYEIKQGYYELLELEEQGIEIGEYLKGIEDQIETKIQNIGLLIKDVLADAEAIKNEEKKLSERRKSLENKAESLKKWIHLEMQEFNIKKIDKSNIVLSIAKNPPKLIVEEEKIPAIYTITETITSIDKKTIKDKLKEGQEIPGASLVQETSLRIK